MDSLFRSAAAVRRLRASPFGAWLDSFTDRLAAGEYTPWSRRSSVVLAADLGRWMAERQMPASALEESVVDEYVKHRKTQRDRRRVAALHFLDHLRAEGIVAPRASVIKFRSRAATLRVRAGPFGPRLDSFGDRLAAHGYTPGSCLSYVVLAADLGRWLAEHGLPASALEESVVDEYVEHRKTQHDRRRVAALHFLDHLRAKGIVAPRASVIDRSPAQLYCSRYQEYLRKERGLSEGTVEGYIAVARKFLRRCFDTGPVQLARLEAGGIGDFLLHHARTCSAKRVQYVAGALRSFFRFLFAQGETSWDLSTAVLAPRMTRFASVPRYLPAADVEKLLESCDLATRGGRRDHAILLLLARLGLRAGEVAALELDDIRWRSGEVVVRGKGDIVDRLPLLAEVGKALALYVTEDRPKTSSHRLFFRLCAPIRPLVGREAISAVVCAALERADLHPPVRGAHILRHSLGTHLIRAGASMAEIGQVLRHHSPGTTEIYAKVDFETLRALAQPWPTAGGAR